MFLSLRSAIAAAGGRDLVQEFEDLAEQLQRSLLHVRSASFAGLDVGVRAAPARLVGGDYVDVIPRGDLPPFFVIGDVSGKALPAALQALTLKYLVRGLAAANTDDIASIVDRAGAILGPEIETDAYVSMVICTLASGHQTLRVANAGHDPPLLRRAADNSVHQMEPAGLVIGVSPSATYVEQQAPLAPGDLFALYTDGFTEARNPDGEQYTLARVKEGLAELHGLGAQALADELFERVERYSSGTLRDDTSIVVVRITA